MRNPRLEICFATTALALVVAGSIPAGFAAPLANQGTVVGAPPAVPGTIAPGAPSAATPNSAVSAPDGSSAAPDAPAPADHPATATDAGAEPPTGTTAPAAAGPDKAPAATRSTATSPARSPDIAAPATVPADAQPVAPATAPGDVPAAIVVPSPVPGVPVDAATPQPATARPADTTAPAPAVAAPTGATAPAATPVEALTIDQQIAGKLRDLFAGKSDRFLDHKYKQATEAFYMARNDAPIWTDNGVENERSVAVRDFLAGVGADGLDPADYLLPSFTGDDPEALAEAELKFTASVLTYAHNAQVGRVHYSRVSADIAYNQVAPEPGAVLDDVVDAKDVGKALDSYNPPQAGYKALKAKLAELRGPSAAKRIAPGATLKLGMSDPRVPALRDRLGVFGGADGMLFDKAVAEAVKKFQHQHGLAPTGTLTNATVEALNAPRRGGREAEIIVANMERWRWLPRDLGHAYVMVNIPDYTLKVVNNGTTVWTTRIVVGQPGEKATPLLSETMKYITVNPTWNVPPSIIHNEYLPALAQDPTVLDRMGLRLEYNRDGSVHIFQPPGEHNALGRIRFNFPNKFLVYQHDTPDKYMFGMSKRALSHGCMRVQYPDQYAEVLLKIANPRDGYTAERIRRMYGTGERDIQLTTPIPVHLTYQTAFVDDAGHLAFRDDIYGRDNHLLATLRNEDRRVADIPVEHKVASYNTRRQVARGPVQPPPQQRQSGFFLFGLFR
jgi:L,D-transpeptidase YcbB